MSCEPAALIFQRLCKPLAGRWRAAVAVALALLLAAPAASVAQEEASNGVGAAKRITLELNGLAPIDGGCRLTFVAVNGLDAGLEALSYEVVLFDRDGLVQRLTVLDFEALSAGKTKVRQFDFEGARCEAIARVLVNGATACEPAAGGTLAPTACLDRLETGSRAQADLST